MILCPPKAEVVSSNLAGSASSLEKPSEIGHLVGEVHTGRRLRHVIDKGTVMPSFHGEYSRLFSD